MSKKDFHPRNLFNKMFNKKIYQKDRKEMSPKIKVAYDFHNLSLPELAQRFETSLDQGLSQETAKALLLKNGKNELKKPPNNLIGKIFKYCFTGFCWLLWIGSLVLFIAWKPLGDPPDPTNLGLAILLIIVIAIQAVFEAFQDWSSGQVMKSIKGMMPSDAIVLRDGVESHVNVCDLVIGDIVVLTNGSKVPADLRLIESHDLKFDRSMITGESEAIEGTVNATDDIYSESKNISYMTTLITNGNGKGLVTLTGKNTMIGSIASLTAGSKEKPTTLQKEISRFVIFVTVIAISTVTFCFIIWGAWVRRDYPKYISVSQMLVNAISILVAFIPTGLPVSLTLSLLLVARNMAKNQVLVKNLTTVETLSCVNVIASDKTGTLTQNKMYVTNAAAGLLVLTQNIERRASVRSETDNNLCLFKSTLQLVVSCLMCNEASFDEEDRERPVNERKTTGSATDGAILKYAANIVEIGRIKSEFKEISRVPFNSKNKWMASVFTKSENQTPYIPPKRNRTLSAGSITSEVFLSEPGYSDCFNFDENCQSVVVVKGAPDILMNKCKWIVNEDATVRPFDINERTELNNLQIDWCKQGQRVLLICTKMVDQGGNIHANMRSTSSLESVIQATDDFCVLGMLGIIDKPREGIDKVIGICRRAGIRVFMVTGDFAVTAAAIASQIGIFTNETYDTFETMQRNQIPAAEIQLDKKGNKKKSEPVSIMIQPKSLLLSGADLLNVQESDWRIITHYEEIVFARTSPAQKLEIVKNLQQDKFVVAVTGDGVNDSPALKQADIGIAMGGGSEVAMEAAKMVLLDNSFNSLVVAIENGRMVFDSLRKVVLFLLPTGSFVQVIPIILNICLGVPMPLSSFQMIVVCVLTDMAPSLALMFEKTEGELLLKPPRRVGIDHLFDRKLLSFGYFFLGALEAVFSMFLFFLFIYVHGGYAPSQVFLAFDKWQPGYEGRYINDTVGLNDLVYSAQTVTFVALVMMQTFGNLLITRAHFLSLWTSFPLRKNHRNLWLFGSQVVSVILMLIMIYIPFINNIFLTRHIPVQYYFYPIAFSVVFIALDELRKFFVRKNIGFFVKTAW